MANDNKQYNGQQATDFRQYMVTVRDLGSKKSRVTHRGDRLVEAIRQAHVWKDTLKRLRPERRYKVRVYSMIREVE